jgi:uncharacterized protein YigE (DUF2233 family)
MIRALLTALLICCAGAAGAVECEDVTFDGQSYTLCRVTADEDLRLFLRGETGEVLGTFHNVETHLAAPLSFGINAGMFHTDRSPVGLYVEEGVQETGLSDGGGYGNFGLLPNGVFCIGETFNVYESEVFSAQAPACRFASQSGPMLVIDGALHPKFLADSSSQLIRNGVGTPADGAHAVFAISNEPVTFHAFARLYRDYLGLPQALFFDGSVSRLYAPSLERHDGGFPLGPILGVVDVGHAAN